VCVATFPILEVIHPGLRVRALECLRVVTPSASVLPFKGRQLRILRRNRI
jgi:hypothetical protein